MDIVEKAKKRISSDKVLSKYYDCLFPWQTRSADDLYFEILANAPLEYVLRFAKTFYNFPPQEKKIAYSPFYYQKMSDIWFGAMKLYKPKRKFKYQKILRDYLPPHTIFPLRNGNTVLGLPIYDEIVSQISVNIRWILGFHTIDNLDFLCFMPKRHYVKVGDRKGIIPTQDRGLVNKWSGYGNSFSFEPGHITYDIDTLYLYPFEVKSKGRTKIEKRGGRRKEHVSYYLDVPAIFLEPLLDDYRNFPKLIQSPGSERIPYTLLYDVKGNLIYFRHKFKKGNVNSISRISLGISGM